MEYQIIRNTKTQADYGLIDSLPEAQDEAVPDNVMLQRGEGGI